MVSATALVALNGVLAGTVLLVALHNAWIWRRDRSDPAPLWLTFLSLTLASVLLTGATVMAEPPSVWMAVALFSRATLIGASSIVAILTLRHLVPGLRVTGWIAVAAVVLLARTVLWSTTDLVVVHPVPGSGWPAYGPLAWTSTVYGLSLLGVSLVAMRRSTAHVRHLLRLAAVGTVAIAIPAAIIGRGLVFEFLISMGVTPAAVAVLLLGARQIARTAEARDLLVVRQAALAALGRAAAVTSADTVRRDAELLLRRQLGLSDVALASEGRTRPGDVVVNGRRGAVRATGLGDLDGATREFVVSVLQTVAAGDDRAASDTDLAHNATHDRLTGLPNRTLLVHRLRERLDAPGDEPVAVYLCGLVGLEERISVDGHTAGDTVVRRLATDLTRLVRDTGAGGYVARVTEDVLAVMEPLPDGDPATAMGRRLARLDEGLAGRGLPGRSLVIGAALAGPDDSAEDVLRDATAALHRAVEGGARLAVFDPALGQQLRERAETEAALARAVADDEIVVHYQPVVAADDGRLVSYEALARWRRDDRIVAPDTWIPVAEETGLILAIGLQVLRIAARDQAQLGVPVAVNVSPLQLADPDFAEHVVAAIGSCPPDQLALEVTESSLMADLDRAGTTLQRLRDLGLQVALDDFGTSYSSLGVLVQLPIDVLKIDRVFVAGLAGDEGRAVVEAIIGLAHTLGKVTVAEGVETDEQRSTLVGLGADRLQGYLTGRPEPLSAHRTTTASEHLR